MDKHEEFKALYKKFINGTRWLNQKIQEGKVTEQDKEDFNRLVVEPMDALWQTLTDEEKAFWLQIKRVADAFDARIM